MDTKHCNGRMPAAEECPHGNGDWLYCPICTRWRDLVRARVPAALLALCLALLGCGAADHDELRSDGPPLYVHLCNAMPEADQASWGDAAGAINAAEPLPRIFVGHGPPQGCDTVDVCPSSAVSAGVSTTVGACTTTVRYALGAAPQVAQPELERLLGLWPPTAAWRVDIGEAVIRRSQ